MCACVRVRVGENEKRKKRGGNETLLFIAFGCALAIGNLTLHVCVGLIRQDNDIKKGAASLVFSCEEGTASRLCSEYSLLFSSRHKHEHINLLFCRLIGLYSSHKEGPGYFLLAPRIKCILWRCHGCWSLVVEAFKLVLAAIFIPCPKRQVTC